MTQPLISIIMPAYNAGKYIKEAINSIYIQGYDNWELLVINDGSVDDTVEIVESFADKRIKIFHQENAGVSAARNVGLSKMSGKYFCFLDADDGWFENSLIPRMQMLEDDDSLAYIDGYVYWMDGDLKETSNIWKPKKSRVNPIPHLVVLDTEIYFGPSWLIRRNTDKTYTFRTDMTHAEDLMFYIDHCNDGLFDYIRAPLLKYRKSGNTAMSNLSGLKHGYRQLFYAIKEKNLSVFNKQARRLLKYRMARILAALNISQKKPMAAVAAFFQIMTLK